MQISPIQNTNFNGYISKDMKKLSSYTMKHKQGSLYDLYRKFNTDLVDNFSVSGRITVPPFTQNWKLGPNSKNKFPKNFIASNNIADINKTGNL